MTTHRSGWTWNDETTEWCNGWDEREPNTWTPNDWTPPHRRCWGCGDDSPRNDNGECGSCSEGNW